MDRWIGRRPVAETAAAASHGTPEGAVPRRAGTLRCLARWVPVCLAVLALAAPAVADVATDPQTNILYERGAHALRTGQVDDAVDYLGRALDRSPDDPRVLQLYARALLEAGRPDEAAAIAERLRNLDPDDADALFLAALSEYRQGNWQAARDYLERARDLRPADPRVRLFLGRAYQELGADTNAERELMEASRLDDDYAGPAAYRLGILKLARNELEEAREFFEEVKAIDPGSELARSAEQYLELLRRQRPRWYSVYLRTAFEYDTNINLAGGNNDLIEISEEDGVRGTAELGLSARLIRTERFQLRAGTTLYKSYHSCCHDFDIEQVRPWALASVKITNWLSADTRGAFENVSTDFNRFRDHWEFQQSLRFTPLPGWLTRLSFRYSERNFRFSTTEGRDRDGRLFEPSIDQYFPIPHPFEWGNMFFRLGALYRFEDSQGREFDSEGLRGLLTFGASLPWSVFMLLDASHERRHYDVPSSFELARDPSASRRLDRITRARVIFRRPIGEHWTVETYYRFHRWDTDVEEFDFKRHVIGVAATFRL